MFKTQLNIQLASQFVQLYTNGRGNKSHDIFYTLNRQLSHTHILTQRNVHYVHTYQSHSKGIQNYCTECS